MFSDIISLACMFLIVYTALKAVDFKNNVVYIVQPVFAVLGSIADWINNLLKKFLNAIRGFFARKAYAALPVQRRQLLLDVHDELVAVVVE